MPPVLLPAAVTIPDLGIEAPLRPETVTGGELVIPGDPRVLGYWHGALGRGGAVDEEVPERGTLVLAGHVDVNGDLGALHQLSRVEPGMVVTLRDADGRDEDWLVDALEVRHKEDLPEFPADGPRRLAIVTCGGPVVSGAGGRSYRDNVIAWATPAT